VTLENTFDKYLIKLKKYAQFIARITICLSFIACGYNSALFGPELPFELLFLAQGTFVVLGGTMLLVSSKE